jgi:acetate kinase
VIGLLNRQSGLLGLSGLSNDMRTLVEAAESGHAQAVLAIEVFCYRLARQILAMAAGLTRIDALVFTGGIGEHSALVRAKALEHLEILHPKLDTVRNAKHGSKSLGVITRAECEGLTVLVVPTNEEWMIARIAADLCRTK